MGKEWVRTAIVLAVLLSGMGAAPVGADGPASEKGLIVDLWNRVVAPEPVALERVSLPASETALLMLDFQYQNCNDERRPRCVASLPAVKGLLERARKAGVLVVYTLTPRGTPADVRKEVAREPSEPLVASGPDKFIRTDLEKILSERGIKTVVPVGTAAHGAVLHTAAGAVFRGFRAVVPVDGMSAESLYAEQYTAWHLTHAPVVRNNTTLTRLDWITFSP
ncbi:Nicotinamidase-related amidase [Desulfacinum infernum DSM 9756]|jgi:nicotinamidase-related amidase|uniref:Nicotinamidase-related amidase n=1 Tax=Desulfacinum infernum DSM 9756 TaxID=1121391 RepID=A0A1M5EGY6_9BACT|nr:cysteine hydrolase [Desulfacinum infernum]SHF78321.1 Nicotinamidase-related amidase [Desulfacinum infernum DSM 9756]